MFTFTGTASAHSVTSLRDDPHISVDSVNRLNRVCLLAGISGWGFHENSDDHADLVAFTDDGRVEGQYTLLTCVTQSAILSMLPEGTLVEETPNAPIGWSTSSTILLGASVTLPERDS